LELTDTKNEFKGLKSQHTHHHLCLSHTPILESHFITMSHKYPFTLTESIQLMASKGSDIICEIWCFHGGEDSSRVHLGCDHRVVIWWDTNVSP